MSEGHYRIRLAQVDELPAIQEIEVAAASLFSETDYAFLAEAEPMEIGFLTERQKEDMVWVAVDDDDKPVGFLVARIIDEAFYINELDVHPSHARRGLGKRLMFSACEWAKGAGLAAATLSTFRDIEWNAPYYAKLGFRILRDEELSPGLIEIRKLESESALPVDKRVCMRMELR